MSWYKRIRILPILIFISILFLGFKLNHFVSVITGEVGASSLLQKAHAENKDPKDKSPQPEEKENPAQKTANKGVKTAEKATGKDSDSASVDPMTASLGDSLPTRLKNVSTEEKERLLKEAATGSTPSAIKPSEQVSENKSPEQTNSAPAAEEAKKGNEIEKEPKSVEVKSEGAKSEEGKKPETAKAEADPSVINQDPVLKNKVAQQESGAKPKEGENPTVEADAVDVEIIANLNAKRKLLEEKQREIEEREAFLQVTEKKVDDKIEELKNLKLMVEDLLGKLDKDQAAQIQSLVKVYESMKPKDAARIFDNLDFDVLIEVSQRMKEAKLAPILSKMDEDRAKNLTRLLADKRLIRPKPDASSGNTQTPKK